jgi:phosphoglycerol transferase
MKVALFNALPNFSVSAEREFIQRSLSILNKYGHFAIEVTTSDEITDYDPDLVIATHEFVAKTTQHFTAGLLWSPTQFYKNDPQRIKAIRSWDLIVPANDLVRSFAKDLHFPIRNHSGVSSVNFVPSSPISDYSIKNPGVLSLAYIGTHWDGSRHEKLFTALSKAVNLNVYGPQDGWRFLPASYRGSLPCDGESVIQALNKHGVVLAIHHPAHIEEDTPSMRVFEALSAKCLVITDPLPSLVRLFGDSLHYIDTCRSPESIGTEVASIIQRYQSNPELHAEIIEQSSSIFEKEVSLDVLLGNLIGDVEPRIKARSLATHKCSKTVSVIIRCGSRPLDILQRAVGSLRSQTYQDLGVIFVRYAEIEGFGDWKNELTQSGRFLFIKDLTVEPGSRSAAMWTGLNAVETEFFSLLDDDDEIFPNHISDLVSLLEEKPEASIAYTGVIRREEDGKLLNSHHRFQGDLLNEVMERRELFFFDDFSLDRLLRHDNFIQSNTWMARKEVLTKDVLEDPFLNGPEDLYFYLLLASRYQFVFTGTVSALWNWRSVSQDNTVFTVSSESWEAAKEKINRRLGQVQFQGGFLGSEILGRGRISQSPAEMTTREVRVPQASKMNLVASVTKRLLGDKQEDIASSEADYLIDFTKDRLPHFIMNSHGLAYSESWGRWAIGPTMSLRFRQELPKKFRLRIRGHAFDSNHGLPVTIKVGSSVETVTMSARNGFKTYTVDMCTEDSPSIIEIRNPNPKSPNELSSGKNSDKRSLGIALASLEITEQK